MVNENSISLELICKLLLSVLYPCFFASNIYFPLIRRYRSSSFMTGKKPFKLISSASGTIFISVLLANKTKQAMSISITKKNKYKQL